MDAAFISDERNCNKHQYYEQNNALFVFGELENSQEALHSGAAQFWFD